jgi:hypothetical protein
MVCRGFMLELDRAGYISLPAKKKNPPNPFINRKKPKQYTIDKNKIDDVLQKLLPIEIEQVKYTDKEKLFNSLIEEYHYLGYCHPVGENIKYLIFSKGKPIACFTWSSAVRHLKPRDTYIGWDAETRKRNIHGIAYNTRFLILPWIKVKNLASYLLGLLSKRISNDWLTIYNHKIYFLETFVDTNKFRGTCYQAANWEYLGHTTGRGKNAKTHKATKTRKAIYGYSLCTDFRQRLCND